MEKESTTMSRREFLQIPVGFGIGVLASDENQKKNNGSYTSQSELGNIVDGVCKGVGMFIGLNIAQDVEKIIYPPPRVQEYIATRISRVVTKSLGIVIGYSAGQKVSQVLFSNSKSQ